jgi:hypothetical protein
MTDGSTSLAHPAPENGAHLTTLYLDRTQVVNYAQWQSREAIGAVRRSQSCGAQIADGFTPIVYELRHSVPAPVSENY